MKSRLCIPIFLICVSNCYSGFERVEGGARAVCFGGAFVGLADDSWAIFYNPAGLARLRMPELGLFYSPQPFGLSELKSFYLTGVYPTSLGSFATSIRSFGFSLYREFSASLAYAREFSGICVGMNFNYQSVSITNYGSAGTIGIDVGVLVLAFKNLRWGIAARNINAPTIGQSAERLPQIFASGISYEPMDAMHLVFDYQKEIGFPPSPKFGFEYWIIDEIAVLGGVADEPSTYAAGLGIRYLFFQMNYAFTMHQTLGLTHQASITLRLM